MTEQESRDFLRKIEWKADIPFRWLLLVLSGTIIASFQTHILSIGILGGLWLYALSNIALMLLFFKTRQPLWITKSALAYSYITDVVFVSFLVYHTGGISSDVYLLYCLLVFKAAVYYPYIHSIIFLAFLFCPLYVYVLYLSSSSFFFLREGMFLLRYFLLMVAVLVGMYTAWLIDGRQKRIQDLYQSLVIEKRLTDEQMRQIMAINEIAKALVSTLDIERVLRLVVDVLASIFGIERCVVALVDMEKKELVGRFGRGVHEEEIQAFRLGIDDGGNGLIEMPQEEDTIATARRPSPHLPQQWSLGQPFGDNASFVVVPLVVQKQLVGAIYFESPLEEFGEEQLDLTTSFAHFATLALENAQLYRHMDENKRELEAVLCSIGDGVIVVDSQCNVIMLNPIARETFHIAGSGFVGRPLSKSVGNKDLMSLLGQALKKDGHSPLVQEIVLRTEGNGRETTYEALASSLTDDSGKRHGAVVVLRNVTKQKELELMKSNFVSIVSHELKTPLHSIKGFVDVILMGKAGELNEVQRDFLETTRDQAKHLQNIINDLLDFTQFESGRLSLVLEQVSLPDLLDEAITRLEPLAIKAEITLRKSVSSDLSRVYVDRGRLLQVLNNLVDNAFKFTPPGGEIALQAFDNGDEIQVEVSDTGIGVPPDERERIFNRFYQIDSSSTRAYRGVGLGLAICKHIVEAHQGRIWVKDNDPMGSVFCFVVPKHLESKESLSLDFSMIPS
jgi:PAS domain S-box-containing protein